jgi:hypothetical protein
MTDDHDGPARMMRNPAMPPTDAEAARDLEAMAALDVDLPRGPDRARAGALFAEVLRQYIGHRDGVDPAGRDLVMGADGVLRLETPPPAPPPLTPAPRPVTASEAVAQRAALNDALVLDCGPAMQRASDDIHDPLIARVSKILTDAERAWLAHCEARPAPHDANGSPTET